MIQPGLHPSPLSSPPGPSPVPAGAPEDGPPLAILHVMDKLSPQLGGPATMLISLAAAQASLGHAVAVLTSRAGDNEGELARAARDVPGLARVRLEFLPPADRRERLLGGRARRWARSNVGRFSVVHTHGVWESIIRAVARGAHAAGVPYVVTPHGMLDRWALARKVWKKRLALTLGAARFVRRADALHALSIHERDCVRGARLHPAPTVIPNGVFMEQVEPLPATGAFRAAHPELGDAPFVLFLARLHPGKGLDLLAEALPRVLPDVPGLRLVVAGPDAGAQADLRARVARLGIADRVHLVGPMWDRSKFAALVDAACFCLPSEHEGFSMSIAEALACGTPVVITRQCHFPEVEEVGAGEVVERTLDDLAAGLRRVLTRPGSRAAYGQAGRRLIQERFTWPRIARRTIDLYRALVGPRARGAA